MNIGRRQSDSTGCDSQFFLENINQELPQCRMLCLAHVTISMLYLLTFNYTSNPS